MSAREIVWSLLNGKDLLTRIAYKAPCMELTPLYPLHFFRTRPPPQPGVRGEGEGVARRGNGGW